jgi:hypothetical protein
VTLSDFDCEQTVLLATCFRAAILLGLFLDTEDGRDVSPKRRLAFSGQYAITPQKTVKLKNVVPVLN